MGCHCLISRPPASNRLIQLTRMFVIVTVQTEQFPVAAIRRVVVVIMVFVMYRQFAQAHSGKLAAAPRTYPWKQFKRPLAIAGLTQFTLLACFGDDAIKSCVIGSGTFRHGG